jgi:hypothetical protein
VPTLPATKSDGIKQVVAKQEPVYKGPREGQFIWTGKLPAGESVTLDGKASSLSGAQFPGVPVRVEVVPAVLSIAQVPSKANRWRSVTIGNSTSRAQTLIIVKWKVVQ